MKSTRERILQTLLINPNATISDLATAVDINSVSVRHHLTSLQADSLVQAQEVRHGVGRPRLVYSLTDRGAELFPTRYLKLVNHLLGELKHSLTKKDLDNLLRKIATDISGEHATRIRNLPIEDKLNSIEDFLSKEGFIIEWEKIGSSYVINEITCPFYHISQKYPEVCTIDRTMFSNLLSTPVEKIKCILSGDNHCAFIILQDEKVEIIQ